ncbi:MAG: hypothetical protein QOH06_3770 [Acidobacteriota bacterium]|jgi:hypothetical protein|nr:hypothetical protein [Acidobacteriota bacterium]
MRRFALTCVCLLLPLAARAQKPVESCFEKANTQLESNECAAKEYSEADAELNRVYKAILEKYKADALFIEKLRAAQRAGWRIGMPRSKRSIRTLRTLTITAAVSGCAIRSTGRSSPRSASRSCGSGSTVRKKGISARAQSM